MNQPRARTLVHLHRMLAIASAQACSRETAQPVPIKPEPSAPASVASAEPVPSASGAPSEVASSSAGAFPPALPPTASATLQQHPPPRPVPTATVQSGYLVVDMLPAPARCAGLANASSSTAAFASQGGQLVLELIVRLPGTGGFKLVGAPSAMGGATVVSHVYSNNGMQALVRLRVPTSATSASVSLPVSCGSAGTGTLYAGATFGAAASGAPVSVSLTDY